MRLTHLLIPGLGVHQNLISRWQLEVGSNIWPSASIAPDYHLSEVLEHCKHKGEKPPSWLNADYIRKSKALATELSAKPSIPGKIYLSVFER